MELCQRETHRALALAVQPVGAVHLVAHVVGDVVVQQHFRVGQRVIDRVRETWREQGPAVEAQQFLLDHAAHHVGDVDLVGAFAELAVEAVAVQQRHEELEVFLLAVVRRGSHQQVVPRQAAQQLAQLEASALVELVAEVVRRHLVGFVHDDQVPFGPHQQLLIVLVAGKLVETGDEPVLFGEVVAAVALLLLLAAEELEVQSELLTQFVLPLLGQRAGRDDEHTTCVGPKGHLPDEQAGHDRLAGAGVVGQHEAQRLTGQHGFVDGRDLVRQGLDVGGVDRHQRVEQVGQTDAVGLQRQLERGGVGVEGPGPACRSQAQAVLVTAKDRLLFEPALRVAVGDQPSVRADLVDVDQPDHGVGHQAVHLRILRQFFELDHGKVSPRTSGVIVTLPVTAEHAAFLLAATTATPHLGA